MLNPMPRIHAANSWRVPVPPPGVMALRAGPAEAVDGVTGLPGRDAFLQAANRLGAPGRRLGVLTLDVERFTELNEDHGLDCGDRLLRQIAGRCLQLAAELQGPCLVGRVGADEFALVWLPGRGESLDGLDPLARRLHERVQGDYPLGLARPLAVQVQMGVVTLEAGRDGAAEALLHAATARRAAAPGSGRVHHYAELEAERRLGNQLRSLLRERRIDIALQPKVNLRTGQLAGFEALARWPHELGDNVPPTVFIPLAERLGLITELGDCVLDAAMAWQAGLPVGVPVAVNVSAPQFGCRRWAERVQEALQRHGLAPSRIELELTESVLLGDADNAVDTLHALRDMGLKVAIDDFGTGYSSLSYLCRFAVDRLKLDRSFVGRLCEDPRTQSLVRAVIAVAHELGLQCVAEGIETPEQLALLRAMGCDEGQGYLLARPMDPLQAAACALGAAPWLPLMNTPLQAA